MARTVRRHTLAGTAVVQQNIPGWPDSSGPPVKMDIAPSEVYAEWWAFTPAGARYLVRLRGEEWLIRKSDNASAVGRALDRMFVQFRPKRDDSRVYVPLTRVADEALVSLGREVIFVAGDPGLPPGAADPLAGLPFELAEGIRAYLDGESLGEAKAVGTAPGVAFGHIGMRDMAIKDRGHFPSTTRFHLRASATNVARDYDPIEEEARRDVGGILDRWLRGRISYDDVRVLTSRAWRRVYEQMRDLGRKAAGLDKLVPTEQHVTHDEETWFRSAVREELRFWQVFLEDVEHGRTVGDRIWQRFDAYVKALSFMYDASRTLAIPEHNTLVYWMGPKKDDPTICEGCVYMVERSPFPKEMLPAVPRDGSTPCLTNCRHKIMVRVVALEEDVRRRKAALPRREVMVRELREIKEGAHGHDHHRRVRRGKALGQHRAGNPFKGHPMPPKTRRGR